MPFERTRRKKGKRRGNLAIVSEFSLFSALFVAEYQIDPVIEVLRHIVRLKGYISTHTKNHFIKYGVDKTNRGLKR